MSRTLREFYNENAEFRQLIAAWIAESRCPIGLVDFLIENGYERQANAANWAANAIELPMTRDKGSVRLGPVPVLGSVVSLRFYEEGRRDVVDHYDRDTYYWVGTYGMASGFCYDYPGQHNIYGATVEDATLGLLDSIKQPTFRVESNYLARTY